MPGLGSKPKSAKKEEVFELNIGNVQPLLAANACCTSGKSGDTTTNGTLSVNGLANPLNPSAQSVQ